MYESIASFSALHPAFLRARRGKRKTAEVAQFELNLEGELFQLERELLSQTWQPGGYRSFYLTDSKRRLISAAPFRDRVVHHALMAQLDPLFVPTFHPHSFANQKGKGTHLALDCVQANLQQYAYYLTCDVRQFFPSIDHAILIGQLTERIADERVVKLCQKILASGVGVLDEAYEMVYFGGDDLWARWRPRGLPIGNLTSQGWANVYLNSFDHWVEQELGCPAYARYVDDFVLFSNSKKQLHQWRTAIINQLAEYRLTLHENSAQVRPCHAGLAWLGFVLTNQQRKLKSRCGWRFVRRLKRLQKQYASYQIDQERLSASVRGWVAHLAPAQTYRLRQSVLQQFVFTRNERI
jgi:retron-type reverse transcriptase